MLKARLAPASRGGFEDAFEFGLVEERDHGRHAHAHRHAGRASVSMVRSRRCGAAARGSSTRASAGSSVVIET